MVNLKPEKSILIWGYCLGINQGEVLPWQQIDIQHFYLKNGILTKVGECLEFFLVSFLVHYTMEEGSLGILYESGQW